METTTEAGFGELPRVFRGYARDAVEALLREGVSACDQARREVLELQDRVRKLGDELEEVQLPERELREAFVTAQREAEELRARAAREAQAIRDEAREREEERLAWLDGESARITSEVERMRGVEHEFHASIRLILLDALRRLEESADEPVATPPVETASPVEPGPAPPISNGPPPVVVVAAPPEARTIAPPPPAPPAAPPAPSLEDDTMDIPPVAGPLEPEVRDQLIDERPRIGRPILYSVAILVAAAGIAVAIWQLRAESPEPIRTATEIVTTEVTVETTAGGAEPDAETTGSTSDTTEAESIAATGSEAAPETAGEPASAAPTNVVLVLRAAGGDCWLSVRAGSGSGKLLFEGFLFQGESRRFKAKRVWIRVGNGGNLAARLNGERLNGLPAGTGDVLVTAGGAQTLALG